MNKVILLAGPTASGKSDLAIYIAKKINGEIINADSMQVYKEVKILSARPTIVKKILKDINRDGDKSLLKYTKKFDLFFFLLLLTIRLMKNFSL